MKCIDCNTINSEKAQFCKNCGLELTYTNTPNIDSPDKSVNLLLIVMATGLFISLFYFVGNKLNFFNYDSLYTYLHIGTNLISFIVTIIIAILIPNKNAKIFLFISLFFQLLFFVGYQLF